MLHPRQRSALLFGLSGSAALGLLASAELACARSHDLGVTSGSSSASSSGGGAGGAGGAGGHGGSASSAGGAGAGGSSSTGATGGGGTGGVDAGPQGPTELTIVNGVNDYSAVRLCFLPYPGGNPSAAPWPASAAGIGFAKAIVVDPISSAIPAGTDVLPWVIAGDLSTTAGKTCGEILALADGTPGAPIVASQLAVLPAAVFDSHKSVLLVPAGCLGGPGHDAGGATLGCGNGYTSVTPTPSLAVVGMSRATAAGKVSLQIVAAALAMPASDVAVNPGYDNSIDTQVTSHLAFGAIAPKPPFSALTLDDYGPLDNVTVRTYQPNTSFSTSITPLSEVFAAGGPVGKADFVNGAGLVLVAVGAYPGVPGGPFWHKLTYVLIKAEPGM